MKELKTGFVAVVGRPNVGKSSLVNAFVGQKVSIVGPKSQTTRNKILGIRNDDDSQIVFVDTPGAIKPRTKLDEYMKKSIDSATDGIDALLVVIDASRICEADFELVEKYKNSKVPIFLVINKTDIGDFAKVYPKLARLNEYKFVKYFYSVSAKTGKDIDNLLSAIKNSLPVGVPLFDEDAITDKSIRFMVAEIIREKALLMLNEEIPHGIAVEVPTYHEKKSIIDIDAEIVANKENHKMIIIGKNGQMLKAIGTAARQDIETLVGKKVNLQIFVKIRTGWQDNVLNLQEYGYDKKDI